MTMKRMTRLYVSSLKTKMRPEENISLEHLLDFVSAVGRCVLILAVALLDGAGIACFSVGLKTCAITAAMKTYKSIINIKERSMLI